MFTYMYYRPTVFNIQPRGRSDRGMCDKVVMVTDFCSHANTVVEGSPPTPLPTNTHVKC
jgi:hypothetical protein